MTYAMAVVAINECVEVARESGFKVVQMSREYCCGEWYGEVRVCLGDCDPLKDEDAVVMRYNSDNTGTVKQVCSALVGYANSLENNHK